VTVELRAESYQSLAEYAAIPIVYAVRAAFEAAALGPSRPPLGGQSGLALLWDLRVAPQARGDGIGRTLPGEIRVVWKKLFERDSPSG